MKKIELAFLHPAAEKFLPLLKKYRAVLIVLLTGMLLLASGGWFKDAKQVKTAEKGAEPTFAVFDLDTFEQDLGEKLSAIEGAGRVSLMLSLDETEEAVYAVDVRQTQTGENGKSYESSLTVLSDGSYGQSPVSVKNLLPTFRGAVVLCDGADNTAVRYAVTQAVSTICGVGTDKVTVLKMAAGT
ncbi:hypothetical protein [Agathobaculum sp.]|uniref:hypothetical protein n=1 Tax=Agathobaculum sp. TaxID=2048138 RepID=UPI002A81C80B|nr:hypothetical protein [Agathobaculum sp.]MDY3618513.1 hypothetical protein [Agathobaculum sp.]